MFCPKDSENFETTAKYNTGFLHSGIIGFTGGSFLGQLFEMKYVKINLSYSLWNQTSITQTLVRIIISGALYGLFSAPYFLVSDDYPESQIPFLYLVKFFMPCFFSSFLLFAFGRVLFMRLNLINEKSMGG
jgi:hypothetical protein